MKAELIGDPACPILKRWTLIPWGEKGTKHEAKEQRFKLLLHHFLPNADERHPHDHPRAFVTFVFRGGYDDMVPCRECSGAGRNITCECDREEKPYLSCWNCTGQMDSGPCLTCDGAGVVLGDVVRAPALHYRPAIHTHKTRVHSTGAWSIVLMGPIVRRWGFRVESGGWMYWKDHQKVFGHGMRCN